MEKSLGVNGGAGDWVLGRPTASQPSLLIYIIVDDLATVVESVIARGGEMVQPLGGDAPEF